MTGGRSPDVYGWIESADIQSNALTVWGKAGADPALAALAWCSAHADAARMLLVSSLLQTPGALLGARADPLPESVIRRLSLEDRGS